MPIDRGTPSDPTPTSRFDLPVRAVRSALDAVEALTVASTTDELFRASRRFSAAAGFLARELHNADEAARFSAGLPMRAAGEVRVVQGEIEKAETEGRTETADPASDLTA